MNEFSPYPNLWKAEKIKSTQDKIITERFLFSLFDTLVMSQIAGRICKIILFLIASDWC